ncbi:hypothetical protein HN954_04025 [bacterium]|jgi:hypothetical protein|nr:hypothetical protein [bacterium]MBT6831743.1 hypothetical protein [bacterium]MBT6996566.1 hypothetical protein [bacterium]MBT7772892.1 hypothetical protein [bacterium]
MLFSAKNQARHAEKFRDETPEQKQNRIILKLGGISFFIVLFGMLVLSQLENCSGKKIDDPSAIKTEFPQKTPNEIEPAAPVF